ncbi:MAG: aspartyl protease family protein [Planctomycetota bacterium]|jgi:predicted aspartyl protease
MNEQESFAILKRVLFFVLLLTYGCADKPKSISDSSAEDIILAEFKIANNGGPILLPVTFINKEHLFVLDTGSSHTVYDTSLRHELGKIKKIEKALTLGSPIKAEIFDAPEAFLGPLNLKDSNEVSCLDLKMLSLIDGKTVSGIIGMNFLKRHVIQIDFDQGTLSFLQHVEEQHPDWGAELPLRYDTIGWPHITCDIFDNINVKFVIDTGSNSTGALGSDIFEKIISDMKPKTSESLFATASGVIKNRECRIDSITVGSFEYAELIFGEANWSHLGLLFLSRHTVTFDFPNSRIYLKKGIDFKKRDETDMSGLHLLRITGNTMVYSVDENSPAQKAGIGPKDIILKVNEKDAGKYDMWELRRLLMSEDNRNITMTIKQGENVKDVTFQLEKKI